MNKLIADCGSTKIEWAIINDSSDKPIKQFRTTGFNAAITSPDEILHLLEAELLPEIKGITIADVHFYGAGCIGGETDRQLASLLAQLMPEASIEIAGDLVAAARALFGKSAGIACILGTGSNSGLYDGDKITANVPPLGYILGDEGSGTYLGKLLINQLFKAPQTFPTAITEDFDNTYHLTKADVINRVYRQPNANRFLSAFAPFLKKHISHSSIRNLVAAGFEAFLSNNVAHYCSATDSNPLQIGFVGSIAHNFADILTEACNRHGFPNPIILQSPLQSLLRYHLPR